MKDQLPTTKTKNLAAASSAQFFSTARTVINSFIVSGSILTKGFRKNKDGSISFIVAQSPSGNSLPLYTRCIMFPSVQNKPVPIPWELIHRGSEVIVRGFRKPHKFSYPSGKTFSDDSYVVLEVIPNDGRSCFLYG